MVSEQYFHAERRSVDLQGSLSLEEALRILAEDEDSEVEVADVFISPPEGNELTDEDSADEDKGGLVDNLTGRQLQAEAEIRLTSNERICAREEGRIGKTIRRKWVMGSMECVGNNTKLEKNDKFYKVRPMMRKIKQKYLQHFVPSQYLDYDEAMIKYYGRHSCKQFIRGRFGYKAWGLNTDTGYLVNFDFYQGINPFNNEAHKGAVGKAAAPLLAMLEEIPNKELPNSIFFDNLFTGLYAK
ncbi:hypothetical protein J437_LFUL012104 [Ladona fulva]|uniref:PiggyBac transposable element-derived protein domain-containing protein n=1 Tax=Ladona fulva TaxID=123851 RepID=A0A8K0P4Y0_LADFU|nr:hypothetical protein J437_LFUL012104 [Ladona fulva]